MMNFLANLFHLFLFIVCMFIFRVFAVFLLTSLFGGCQEEKVVNEKDVSKDANARENDSDNGVTDEENSDENDKDDDKKRRQTYTPQAESPINEANARLYIHDYLALLKSGKKDKPIDFAQKYKVAGKVDGGKFLHAFPDDHNEHVLLDLGFPIVRDELDKRETYTKDAAHKRWLALPEHKKSAMGHLFLETLIRELHEMNSEVHN